MSRLNLSIVLASAALLFSACVETDTGEATFVETSERMQAAPTADESALTDEDWGDAEVAEDPDLDVVELAKSCSNACDAKLDRDMRTCRGWADSSWMWDCISRAHTAAWNCKSRCGGGGAID